MSRRNGKHVVARSGNGFDNVSETKAACPRLSWMTYFRNVDKVSGARSTCVVAEYGIDDDRPPPGWGEGGRRRSIGEAAHRGAQVRRHPGELVHGGAGLGERLRGGVGGSRDAGDVAGDLPRAVR